MKLKLRAIIARSYAASNFIGVSTGTNFSWDAVEWIADRSLPSEVTTYISLVQRQIQIMSMLLKSTF